MASSDLENKFTAIASVDGDNNGIRAGQESRAVWVEYDKAFSMLPPNEDMYCCLVTECAFLNGGNWIVDIGVFSYGS